MTWLIEILKTQLEAQFLINYFVIKNLMWQKTRKYDGYQMSLASMVYKFFIKRLQVVPLRLQTNLLLKMKIFQTKN